MKFFTNRLPKLVYQRNDSEWNPQRVTYFYDIMSRKIKGRRQKIGSIQALDPEYKTLWQHWRATRKGDRQFLDSPHLNVNFLNIEIGTTMENGWLLIHTPSPDLVAAVRYIFTVMFFGGLTFAFLNGMHIGYVPLLAIPFTVIMYIFGFFEGKEMFIHYYGKRKEHEHPKWLERVFKKRFKSFSNGTLYLPEFNIGLYTHSGAFWWSFLQNSDEWDSRNKWWQQGSFSPMDFLFGDYVVSTVDANSTE